MKRLLASAAIIFGVLAPLSSQAHAESGHDSSKEPFRIELTQGLPEDAVTATFENGIVTLEVLPSHTLTAVGIEDEEFIRIDEKGRVSVLTTSMTYEMAELEVSEPTEPKKLESGWSEIGSGVVTYHEHRIHFMASKVDPAIKDGGIVSTFELGFIVDGEAVTASGNLVFDPSMNENRAAELVSPAHDMDGMGHEHHSDGSQTPWFLVIGVPAVFFIALGAFILKARRRSN
jgi:hypothetical protein